MEFLREVFTGASINVTGAAVPALLACIAALFVTKRA